jgi:hypothetical protein
MAFADWDACAKVGGCGQVSDAGFGRGTKPRVNFERTGRGDRSAIRV